MVYDEDMGHSTRLQFLTSLGAAATLPLTVRAQGSNDADRAHAFIAAPQIDTDEERMWHGYPDECYSLTTFADSLVALAWGHGWYMQPPMVDLRNAIVVDFASETEAEAEASIATGWNGAWEFPMGVVNTVASRVETNAQNACIERHITLIGTAMRQEEFRETVIDQLFDARVHPGCKECSQRPHRTLADILSIPAYGTDQAGIQLFSKWEPSEELRAALQRKSFRLIAHPLSSIPTEDLEANRFYHIWDGTPLQAEEFRRAVWAPAWRGHPRALA